MTFREARCLFSKLFAQLITWANEQGYETAIHEVVRSKEQAQANAKSGTGIANSLHCEGLAGDVNLYRNGKYLQNTEDHAALGAYWKSLHPLCRWGGDFKSRTGAPRPDGNHYSIEWQGRQ